MNKSARQCHGRIESGYGNDIGKHYKKDLVLFDLANIVNTADHETNDVIIAKAFPELRDDIDNWTQDQIARKYYLSQAGISRFITKLGFKNFGQLKTQSTVLSR